MNPKSLSAIYQRATGQVLRPQDMEMVAKFANLLRSEVEKDVRKECNAALASQASKGAGVPEGWRVAIDGLMDFAPNNRGPLPGMTRGGDYVRKADVIEALAYRAASPAQAQPILSEREIIELEQRRRIAARMAGRNGPPSADFDLPMASNSDSAPAQAQPVADVAPVEAKPVAYEILYDGEQSGNIFITMQRAQEQKRHADLAYPGHERVVRPLYAQASDAQGDALSQAFEAGMRLANEQACKVTHGLMAERDEAFAKGRAAGIEEAAKACEEVRDTWAKYNERRPPEMAEPAESGADDCIAACRALAAKPAEGGAE